MDAPRAGIHALQRNAPLVGAYIGLGIVFTLAANGLDALFLSGPLSDVTDTVKRLADVVKLIVVAATYAGLNAIVFSLLGADIDRPLWRYKGWKASLAAFFTPWFLLTLCFFLINRIMMRLGPESAASQPLLTLSCIVFTIHLPIGVAIMHQGRFEWRLLLEALTPLVIQLPRMAIPLLAGMILFFFLVFNGAAARPDPSGSLDWLWRAPLLEVIAGIVTCGIVATTWCVLILHRDEADEDFDL